MNFYKRHLGDFARDTAHLSQAQVGCYDLLLDWYYSNERPLPVKPDALHRIGRAATKAERENVDAIIAEFFEATEDGYIQKRARAEIDAMQRQRDVNREIGKRGGRPKGSGKKPNGNRIGFDSETEKEPIENPSQNPESREEQKASFDPRSVAAPVDGKAVDPPRSSGSSDDVADPPQLELDEPPADDAVAHLRAVSGQLVPITTTMRDRFAEAYPLVDVPGALRRAALWLEANPRKRPTAGGVLRFVTTWLGRDQQRAAESGVRGFQSARVIDGGRRESLSERAERLAREGDEREARSIRVLHGSLA